MQAKAVAFALLAWLSPGAAALACEAQATPAGEAPLDTRKPVRGDDVRLTSGFGMRRHPLLQVQRLHPGVDWAAPMGTPVIAAGAGRVAFADWKGEYGRAVVIDHGSGWQTRYTQLARIHVGAGDCVASGALVGEIGSTGLSAGPHLHFEVLRDGEYLDPLQVRIRAAPDAR
jgi:murein DD-endopeptidase MepM/ murein hydrolase activator NlpD